MKKIAASVMALCFLGQSLFPQGASAYRERAAALAASLDDHTLAAQVLMTGISGRGALGPDMLPILEQIPVGAVMLFRYNLDSPPAEVRALLSQTQALVSRRNGIAPFMAVDHEGGLVHRFGPGIERLPSAYSFWELAQREGRPRALSQAQELYTRSAAEIASLGITMVLAPVAEILNEENRVFLQTRSFGPDGGFVEDLASVYIRAMADQGIASVVKHFPGHSSEDPHYGVSALGLEPPALEALVRPFRTLVRTMEPASIMVSHVLVPAVDRERIASLSAPVMQSWLRGDLGFQGIIMADDYFMQAVALAGLSPQAAAVEGLNAGVDMIMVWPHNIGTVHRAILDALANGSLSRERLAEAAARILAEKLRYGLIY